MQACGQAGHRTASTLPLGARVGRHIAPRCQVTGASGWSRGRAEVGLAGAKSEMEKTKGATTPPPSEMENTEREEGGGED